MKTNVARIFFLCVLFFSSGQVFSQDIEPISTDRPTRSISSYIIPQNSFQFEQGFLWQDTLFVDGFFRLGVSRIGEIRLLTFYNSPAVNIGAKVKLLEQKDYRPGFGIDVLISDFKFAEYRLMIDQKVSDRVGLNLNVGKAQKFFVILNAGFVISKRFNTYLEAFFEKDFIQLNSGLLFLLDSETQLDVNFGWYDFGSAHIGVGFARRFMFKN